MEDLIRRFEPRVARALREAINEITDQVSMAAIGRAIEAGDLERAINLVGADRLAERMRGQGLEPGATSFTDEIRAAFDAGGTAAQRQLPREAALQASLDLTNPEAVVFLRENVPRLIREISEETREAVRQAVLRGFEEGRPIRLAAREIRDSVGLTIKQSQAVANFRRQLETGQLGNGKAPWQRRLSASEQAQARSMFRQAAEGSPVDSSRINEITERYRQSLINRRAQNIARTETHRAFIEGQQEQWRQAVEEGLLDPEVTRRIWIVMPDDRLRRDHRAVPGMNEGGVTLDGKFQTPVGLVDAPGLSDDPAFNINCRCALALEIDE